MHEFAVERLGLMSRAISQHLMKTTIFVYYTRHELQNKNYKIQNEHTMVVCSLL